MSLEWPGIVRTCITLSPSQTVQTFIKILSLFQALTCSRCDNGLSCRHGVKPPLTHSILKLINSLLLAPRCSVSVRPHQMARLYFIDFALEESRECWLDRLEVWEERLLLGGYCGRRPPPLLLSNKTYVKLVFMSDRYISSRGFVALLEYISIYK